MDEIATKKDSHKESDSQQRDYFEIKLPKFPKNTFTFQHFLTLLLIIFAYLLGAMTIKLQDMQKGTSVLGTDEQSAPTQNPDETTPIKNVKVDPGDLPIRGNKNAKVTLIEFSDFQCPFCEQFFTQTLPQIEDEYIKTGKVKMAYRNFPLSIHPNAEKAAEAGECANEQGKFWEFHDMMFQKQSEWADQAASDAANTWASYAADLGLDQNQFTSCLSSDKYKQKVADDEQVGTTAGVDATPTFVINGQMVVGALPFDNFKKIIDEQLQK